MKISKRIQVETSDAVGETQVAELVGMKMPYAFLINEQANGYGKFVIDEQTLTSFEANFGLIEDKLTRKQSYNMMYDMIKSGKIAASRVLQIIHDHISTETAEDVIQDVFRFIVPATIKRYIPLDTYQARQSKFFHVVMKILKSGRFAQSTSTMELLLTSAITFASTDDEMKLVHSWFKNDKVVDLEGNLVEGIQMTLQHKHSLVSKISGWTKDDATLNACLDKLRQDDKEKSDLLGRTEMFCKSARPILEEKRKAWEMIFDNKSTLKLTHM